LPETKPGARIYVAGLPEQSIMIIG
jgi:hypothetical protein